MSYATDSVTRDDSWSVIHAYFEEKGLVRQQLDSFDEFVQNTMQELVDDTGVVRCTPNIQHTLDFEEDGSKDLGETKVFEEKVFSKTITVFLHWAIISFLGLHQSLHYIIEGYHRPMDRRSTCQARPNGPLHFHTL